MQAETIHLLSGKGKFPTEQALALAEAIDMAIEKQQIITVPILEARLEAVEAQIVASEARLEARMDASFAAIDVKFAALDAKFAAIDGKFGHVDGTFALIDARFHRLELRLIIAILVSQFALGPVGIAALDMLRRVFSALIH